MLNRVLPLLATLAMASVAQVAGQRLVTEFPRFRPRVALRHEQDTTPRQAHRQGKDYTWEGVAIGSLMMGGLGASFGEKMCGMGDHVGKSCTGAAITGLLSGATIGTVLGGFIGSTIKKAADRP